MISIIFHLPLQVYNSTKPLRIGYFMTDGDYNPLPPCQRAVSETKQLLESQGHTVILHASFTHFLLIWPGVAVF